MILDTSAIMAVLFREPDCESLLEKIGAATKIAVGAPTLVEAGIVISARIGESGRGLLARFLDEAGIETIPFTDSHFGVAVEAWLKFGRGRHKAGLNLGDCLAYAVALVADRPLLCIGDDFTRTDLRLA
jgi:ribonuclease VapC